MSDVAPRTAQTERARAALKVANSRRLARADIVRRLKAGHLRFDEIDFGDPVLETMRVAELVACLPWKRAACRDEIPEKFVVRRSWNQALRLVGRVQMTGRTRVGSLSSRRLEELCAAVNEYCCTQRVTS